MTVVSEYLAVAGAVRSLLANGDVAKYWEYPSALEEWTVAGLAGHLARPVLNLSTILRAEVPAEKELTSAVNYYAEMPVADLQLASTMATEIRQRGIDAAGSGIADLLQRYDSALTELHQTLPSLDAQQEVVALGVRMLLTEYLVTRMVEMLVHADDLATSIGTESPKFPIDAVDAVVATLACISARRNNPTDILRALARAERPIQQITAF
ncbi:MAG: maleylpyruvate isomerase N-terminal domain-containing protein [Actinomycetota bacterium]|nr:maleylpyruvate isomerase N-terminal domain-containing protein [Actinomycetota bacterium]